MCAVEWTLASVTGTEDPFDLPVVTAANAANAQVQNFRLTRNRLKAI